MLPPLNIVLIFTLTSLDSRTSRSGFGPCDVSSFSPAGRGTASSLEYPSTKFSIPDNASSTPDRFEDSLSST